MGSRKREPCAVCFSKMDLVSVGECGHRVCCATCAFRLRELHCDEKCVICKTALPKLFIVPQADSRTFQDLCKPALATSLVQDQATSIYLTWPECEKFKLEMDGMRRIECCGVVYPNAGQLGRHLETSHKHKLCQLCLDHRGLFFQEHPRLTLAQLAQHVKREHPSCKFCHNKPFYNQDAMGKHLSEKHEQCHVCTKLAGAGGNVDYFKDYESLEVHFRMEHFLCEQAQCRRVHFVNVFASEMEWLNHDRMVHGKQTKGPIKFEFAYKDRFVQQDDDNVEEERAPTAASLVGTDFPPLNASASRVVVSTGAGFASLGQRAGQRPANAPTDFPPLRGQKPVAVAAAAGAARRGPSPSLSPPPVSSASDFPSLAQQLSRPPPAAAAAAITPKPSAVPAPYPTASDFDFPSLQRPNRPPALANKLSREQVRELAFGPAAASRAVPQTTGLVLVGKKKQTDAAVQVQVRKQKERKDLQSLVFKQQ